MKIGILTFHLGINYGGFLQAFSLMSYLKSLGHEVSFVPYQNPVHRWAEAKMLFFKKPKRCFDHALKYYRFKQDQKQHCSIKNTVHDFRQLKEHYDVIIVGSDIVWDYSLPWLGQDPIYFGHGLKGAKLLAYAVSSGTVHTKTPIPSYVHDGLPHFRAIAVRDEHTHSWVQKHAQKNIPLVVDPTLLIDLKELTKHSNLRLPKNSLVIYAQHLNSVDIDAIKQYAKSKKLCTVSLGYSNPWCEHHFERVGPMDWLKGMTDAHCIYSNTFHGMIISVALDKQFAMALSPFIKNKCSSIIQHWQLEEHVIQNHDLHRPFQKLISEEQRQTIHSQIEDSKMFLMDQLKSIDLELRVKASP